MKWKEIPLHKNNTAANFQAFWDEYISILLKMVKLQVDHPLFIICVFTQSTRELWSIWVEANHKLFKQPRTEIT